MDTNFLILLLIGLIFVELGNSIESESIIASIDEFSNIKKRPRPPDCKINIQGNGISEEQPLLLVPGINEFRIPSPNGVIEMILGETIELFCEKNFASPFEKEILILATCNLNNLFVVKGQRPLNFNTFKCKDKNKAVIKRTDNFCFGNSSEVQIGFKIKNRFLRTIRICHDEINQATDYAYYKLYPSNVYQSKTTIKFAKDDFYNGTDVIRAYTKKQEKETLRKILSGAENKYFDETKYYFAAGHLSARADHIFEPQQRATYYYINAAPQWQIINNGNWKEIEILVRKYVHLKEITVECYTGTWGISELKDIKNNFQKLYLSFEINEESKIPVPMLYYRVVVEGERGIVLITVNNPHLKEQELRDNGYIICSDISNRIAWIKLPKKRDTLRGYSYACTVQEFIKKVDHLPHLNYVNKILI